MTTFVPFCERGPMYIPQGSPLTRGLAATAAAPAGPAAPAAKPTPLSATKPAPPTPAAPKPKAVPLTAAAREALELQCLRLKFQAVLLRDRLAQRQSVQWHAERGDPIARIALSPAFRT
jgi:pyruvate/2-oxoglutarate dehydrogenase complex dihydrolipoamide acyltransferase (E2) component